MRRGFGNLNLLLSRRGLHTARVRLTDLLATHKHKIIGAVGAIVSHHFARRQGLRVSLTVFL